jgi:hypothetical protein
MAEMLPNETRFSWSRYFTELYDASLEKFYEFRDCLREDLRILYGQRISIRLEGLSWVYSEMRFCGFVIGLAVEEEVETVSAVEILRFLGMDFTDFLIEGVNCDLLWELWGDDDELNLEITCQYIYRVYGPTSEYNFKRLIGALQISQSSLRHCIESVLMGEYGNFCEWGVVAIRIEEEHRRQRPPLDWASILTDNNNV